MSPNIQAIIAGFRKHLALSTYPTNTNKVLIQPNASIILLSLQQQFQTREQSCNLHRQAEYSYFRQD